MRSVVVIPARFSSSRFPGKPLVNLLGKPMILWVAELSSKAVGKENVYIATDDKRISSIVTSAGFNVVMTSDDCLTGTDRLAEAATQIDADIFINVQGDEPLVDFNDITKAIKLKENNFNCVINGYCFLGVDEDVNNLNIPKVITNENDVLVYMSRNALPGFKDFQNKPNNYKKQVCIYAFNKDELAVFKAFSRKSQLEASEDIEILRFLELGKTIKMFETRGGSLAVDVPDDVESVERALKKVPLI